MKFRESYRARKRKDAKKAEAIDFEGVFMSMSLPRSVIRKVNRESRFCGLGIRKKAS